jgi:NADP-dependent 3-hydroxy acid dehydrogenase YdfG
MPDQISALIVGGTSGIGREIAHALARRGEEVTVTGRDKTRAQTAAAEIGGRHRGLALDLTKPDEIVVALATVGPVDHLVLAAVERDQNSVRTYDTGRAIRLLTLKVVGYTAVVHALAPRFSATASIVVLGGLARDWPYPGSTTITMANGAVSSMVRTLARRACAGARQRHPSRRGWRQPRGEIHAIRDDRGRSGAHANRPVGNDGRCCGSHAFTAR